jgi:protein-tyrosine phosphatase
VLRSYLADAGLAGRAEVESAGTGNWHVGDPADRRSLRALADAGYDGSTHRARQFEASWFSQLDLVLALDATHLADLRELAPDSDARAKIRLLRSFDAEAVRAGTLDVDDPFYGGVEDFERVLVEVEAACAGLVTYLSRVAS